MPPVNVLTNRYENARTGANLQEDRLNVGNVQVRTFGKLFGRTVDGDLYAQPLIVGGLTISGKARNVVYLATSRNWVYAYDADDPDEVLPLWERNLGLPVPRDEIFRAMSVPGHYLNFGSEIGITSTPVIGLSQGGGAGTLYVVAKTRSGPATRRVYAYHLHALDILTGQDAAVPNNPVTITAQARKATGETITFDPVSHLNRPGLLLHQGVLYLAFGSHGDEGTFFGWVMAYDAATLAQRAVYCTAPDWGEGGIWQSGCGLAGDSEGFVYSVVGNGERPSTNARKNPPVSAPARITAPVYGNCILKLKLAQNPQESYALEVRDWFTATDCMDLNEIDQDLVAGPVLFEAGSDGARKRLVLGCGKDGRFYLLNRDRLGGFAPRTGGTSSHWDPNAEGGKGRWISWAGGTRPQNALQDDQLCKYHIHGTPVLWQKSETDLTAYVWSEKDFLAAIRFRDGKFDPTRRESTSQYGLPEDELRMPGGILTLSANGNQDGTGIVWASHPTDDDAMNKTVKGTLRAYDARDLNVELWNSDQDASGIDRVGLFAKFCPPVVANGKVYLATFSRELAVYGLLADVGQQRGNEAGIFELRPFGRNVPSSMCAFSCSRYDLTGGGEGLGGREDSFFFAFRTIDSDEQPRMSITARLIGLSNPAYLQNRAARAGIMIRKFGEPADVPSSRYAALVITADNQAMFQRRLQDRADSTQDGPVPAVPPYWLRLSCERIERGSFSLVGELSADGKVWNRLSAATIIPLDGRLLVGLVITAQTGAGAGAPPDHPHAVFADVEVTPVL